MSDIFQWAIVIFIVLSVLYHVWKGGRANPEGTGSLGRKVNGLSSQVSALSGRTAQQVSALSDRVGQVEVDVKDMKRDGATTADVSHLEKLLDSRLDTIRTEMAGHKEMSEGTSRNVQRIYDLMLNKGLGG